MASLKQKTLKGLTWSSISQITKLVSQFVVTAILAKLLNPGDFGLLGMANIFIYCGTLINEKGFSSALIQNQKADELHYSSVFWINIALGITFLVLLNLMKPVIVSFYGRVELTVILEAMSTLFILLGISVVQRTLLTKSMEFKLIAIIDTTSFLTGGAVGIYMALNDYGVISLVCQTLTQAAVASTLFWIFSKWRPRFLFSLKAIKDLFQFGIHVTGTSLLGYFSNNIEFLLIGKFLGAEALGYYTLAFKLMMVPVRNIAWMVSQVMYPAYSSIQNDINKVRSHYLITLKAIGLVTFPMMCGLFVLAPEFVYSVAGSDWAPSILLIRILCIVGILKVISTSWSSVIMSQGRSGLQFRLSLLDTILKTAAFISGLSWGLYGAATFYAIQQLLWIPFAAYKSLAAIRLPMKTFYRLIIRVLLFNIPMMIVVATLQATIELNNLTKLIVFSAAGMAVYGLIFWKWERHFILDNLPRKKLVNKTAKQNADQ